MARRALLIGAAEYGDGFTNLPAAEQDVLLMKRTLTTCGFAVEVVSADTVRNASLLESAISDFCAKVTSDVGIVYFSGHGVSIDGQEWILPAGVSRAEAARSATHRVSTDLSPSVVDPDALVIFIIDACRDDCDHGTEKGGRPWTKGSQAFPDKNFIRIFGCAEKELCHVWRCGSDGKDVSVFTAALARALAPDSRNETLQEVLNATGGQCEEIAAAALPRLPPQRPSIGSMGDINTDTLEQLSRQPIFRRTAMAAGSSDGALWENFDPRRLHCLVVESEHAGFSSDDPLREKVNDVFLQAGDSVWQRFRRSWLGRSSVAGTRRDLPEDFDAGCVTTVVFRVHDAFRNRSSLKNTIRAVVQADLAFFDLTRFEPGVMFLLGIRAATRRGVTLCSHGYGWREGRQLETPFNLSDLQVFSHSETETTVAEDPVVRRFIEGTARGFDQLLLQPRYLDLPAYDSLRQLGSDVESWGTIPLDRLVLALCSFRPEHREAWLYVRRGLEKALQQRGVRQPRVRRLIDLGSSQLVSQALYEHIRRVAGCVMDWSLFSPSSFLELGVRLAVSPWGALQIVDERYLPGADLAARVRRADGQSGPELQQVALMNAQLEPRRYQKGAARTFDDLADALVKRRPFDELDPSYNWVHQVVREAIEPVSVAYPEVHDLLDRSAESLSSTEKDRVEATQTLFAASRPIKRDAERAAVEQRIAAWLYLEHRVKPRGFPEAAKALHQKLGEDVAAALYDSDVAEDFALAETILKRLKGDAP